MLESPEHTPMSTWQHYIPPFLAYHNTICMPCMGCNGCMDACTLGCLACGAMLALCEMLQSLELSAGSMCCTGEQGCLCRRSLAAEYRLWCPTLQSVLTAKLMRSAICMKCEGLR